jgi:hypothetical protein
MSFYLLQNIELRFKPSHFTKLMFFNEVSPIDTYHLLVDSWGVGEHLTVALMNIYGGHWSRRKKCGSSGSS